MSQAPSPSKTGRAAARSSVMLVPVASPKSGSVRADRLGRDELGLFHVRRLFDSLGISLHATDENIDDAFTFGIQAVVAAHERRKFLERSAEGMNRAAREGRYTGGIVPLGYTVSGDRGASRLVPDDSPMWADLSAADVVRRIYRHLAVDGWSCKRIAKEFNDLGIPTAYRRDGRGVRGKRTQGNLALRTCPQPRPQYRLQGRTPVRPQVHQAQWPPRHLRSRRSARPRRNLERRHRHAQAQPHSGQQLPPHLPPPLRHPLRRLRPRLLRYLGQNRASLQVQRRHGRARPLPRQVHRRLHQG